MPVREIKARLEALRLSHWRGNEANSERIPLAALAAYVGCDDSLLRKVMLGNVPMSECLQIVLGAAFRLIDTGQLSFERSGRQWKAVRLDLPEPGQPSRQYAVVFKGGGPSLSLSFQPADTSRRDFLESFERIKSVLTLRKSRGN